MNLEKTSAFDVLLQDSVMVTATRRIGGATKTFTGSVGASIIPGGDPADGGGQKRINGAQFSVTLRNDGYPTVGGPAFGDRFQHPIHGTMTVQANQPDGPFWTCLCVARMGAPTS